MDKQPFQDYWDKNQCWGCGKNEHGLQIKSYWDENESVCIWKPHKHHKAGPSHILNGGIIGTLIDCHSICTAIANEYKLEERELDSKPLIWCVTASLKVDYYLRVICLSVKWPANYVELPKCDAQNRKNDK